MYSDEEKLKLFRTECGKYGKYKDVIDKLEKDRSELITKMENIHSPITEKIGSNPNKGIGPQDLLRNIEKKEHLEKRIAVYERAKKWVTDVIDSVPYPTYRSLIWVTYVQHVPLASLSDTYNVDIKVMSKNRKRCIIAALTQEKMDVYSEIQSLLEYFEQ